MLNRNALATLRGAAVLNLPDRGNVMRAASTKTLGNTAQSYAVSSPNVPCRVAATRRNATEQPGGGKMQGSKYREVQMPQGTDITERDRFNVTNRDGQTVNELYEVLDVGNTSYSLHLIVQVRQIS